MEDIDWTTFDERELAKLSAPDPEFQEYITANPWSHPFDFNDVANVREQVKAFDQENMRLLGPLPPNLEEFEKSVPLRDGVEVPARIVRPIAASSTSTNASNGKSRPLIVLFHGGGFTLGTELQTEPFARGLASLFDAVVISATYRLAPEHPFPTGPLDAYDVLSWAASSATKGLGAEPAANRGGGFIVGGVSAGGNISAVLTQLSRERGLSPPLTGQWVCVPLWEPHEEGERRKWISRRQNKDAAGLSTEDQDILDGYYQADNRSELYSPLNSDKGLRGTPKSLVHVCGGDPLRDDGLLLAKGLLDAGVDVKLEIFRGLPHAFWMFFPQLRSTRKYMVDLAQGFAWLLGKSVDANQIGEVLFMPTP
ncbi:MAG: hypothetical protein Q9227_007202 [Pyrenula ochraceoflavens]